jgi:hypothetical protein
LSGRATGPRRGRQQRCAGRAARVACGCAARLPGGCGCRSTPPARAGPPRARWGRRLLAAMRPARHAARRVPRRADRTRLTVAGADRRAWARIASASWGTSPEESHKPEPSSAFSMGCSEPPAYRPYSKLLIEHAGLAAAGESWGGRSPLERSGADLPCGRAAARCSGSSPRTRVWSRSSASLELFASEPTASSFGARGPQAEAFSCGRSPATAGPVAKRPPTRGKSLWRTTSRRAPSAASRGRQGLRVRSTPVNALPMLMCLSRTRGLKVRSVVLTAEPRRTWQKPTAYTARRRIIANEVHDGDGSRSAGWVRP